MAVKKQIEPQQLGFFDINGVDKLSLESAANREAIIKHYVSSGEGLFYVSTSGGVDSAAMWEVISRLVPRDKIVPIHASLGKYEHRGVISHIEKNIDGHELVVKNKKRSLIDQVLLRGMWFSAKMRFCTSSMKQDPIFSFLRSDFSRRQAENPLLKVAFNCTGIISAESPGRAKKNPLYINANLTTKKRTVYDFMPIYNQTKEQVWKTITDAGKKPHEAYGEVRGEGNDRLSCVLCMLGSPLDLVRGARSNPKIYHEYIAVERLLKHTMFGRSTQKTHYDEHVNLLTGKVVKNKRVVKTFHPIPLEEKIGLPYDELAVHWYIKKHTKRRNELLAIKAEEEAIAAAKRKEKKSPKKQMDVQTIPMNY